MIIKRGKYSTAVWRQTGWLKNGNFPVKYSQPVHKRMNTFECNAT